MGGKHLPLETTTPFDILDLLQGLKSGIHGQ